MMNEVSKDQLKRLSTLSALDVEWKEFIDKFENVLEFVGQLDEVDTDGIDPMSHPLDSKYLDTRNWVKDFEHRWDMLENTKHKVQNNGIVVKSTIS